MEKTYIEDRLGDLPDHVIHIILSLMETKEAIQTCVLSKRWRYMWTSVPCLHFNSLSFKRLVEFRKFVLWVLHRRGKSQVKILIYLRFGVGHRTNQYLLNKVIEYAVQNHVEEIRINLRMKKSGCPPVEIPLPLFSCQSLKKLEIKNCHVTNLSAPYPPISSKSLDHLDVLHLKHISVFLPLGGEFSNLFACMAKVFGFTTLTALHLNSFAIYNPRMERIDLFASCVNLKILQLSKMCFKLRLRPKEFVISAPKLSNLCLMCNQFRCKIVITSPQLLSFTYLYSAPSALFEFGLPSLDGLNIDAHTPLERSHRNKREDTLHGLFRMLLERHEAEVVKLSFCTIAVTCGDEALEKQECFPSTSWESLNLRVGLKYTLSIDKVDRIKFSQPANF